MSNEIQIDLLKTRLRQIRNEYALIEREIWELQGKPPLRVLVQYDDGNTVRAEEFEYSDNFMSPDIPGSLYMGQKIKVDNV